MSTFTVTGDWSSQGVVTGNVFFIPIPEGDPVSASIANSTLNATLPVIDGAYMVQFTNVSMESFSAAWDGYITPFQFSSASSGATVDLFTIVSPPPLAVTHQIYP